MKRDRASSLTAKLVRYESILRRNVKSRWPVEVRLTPGLRASERRLGQCGGVIDVRRKRWVLLIEIDPSMSEQEALDTLLHEYAHAVAWNTERKQHGPKWGAAYAKCYRAAVEGERRLRRS